MEFLLLPQPLTHWGKLGIPSCSGISIFLGKDGPVTWVVTALLRGAHESDHRSECTLRVKYIFHGQHVIIHLVQVKDGKRHDATQGMLVRPSFHYNSGVSPNSTGSHAWLPDLHQSIRVCQLWPV